MQPNTHTIPMSTFDPLTPSFMSVEGSNEIYITPISDHTKPLELAYIKKDSLETGIIIGLIVNSNTVEIGSEQEPLPLHLLDALHSANGIFLIEMPHEGSPMSPIYHQITT